MKWTAAGTRKIVRLNLAYDGPIPPAELAAARWGPGSHDRLLRGADAALIESRLRAAVAALGRLRSALGGEADRDSAGRLRRLARSVTEYRRAAVVTIQVAGTALVS